MLKLCTHCTTHCDTTWDNVIKNFEEKFNKLHVEVNRKEANSSSVMFTEEKEYCDAEEMDKDDLDDED